MGDGGLLHEYLQEEADLAAAGGGKLRSAILTGSQSEACMAALRSMALICDSVLWKVFRAIKPTADKHNLDVLAVIWPKVRAFFAEAAANLAGIIDNSLLLSDLGAAKAPSESAIGARRSVRAKADMERICARSTNNDVVLRLLAAAFTAMTSATENHAAEWLPGSKLYAGKITAEIRAKYDALVTTSTSVERLHALRRHADKQASRLACSAPTLAPACAWRGTTGSPCGCAAKSRPSWSACSIRVGGRRGRSSR
jgi:hypothetical protein